MRKILILTCVFTFYLFSGISAQTVTIDSLRDALTKVRHDTSRLSLLHKLCKSYWYIQPEESLKFGEQAWQLATKLDDRKGLSTALFNLGIAHWVQSKYDIALEEISQSLEISQTIHDKEGMARGYGGMGVIYRNKADYPSALEFQDKALKINEEMGNLRGTAIAYTNIGVILYSQGDLPSALDYNLKALKIYEDLGNQLELAGAYNNIGVIYNDQENHQDALQYYGKALKLQQEINDKKGIAHSHINIGNVYIAQRQDSLALSNFSQALTIYEELEDQQGIAASYTSIGDIFYAQEKYAKAKQKYFRALALLRKIGYRHGLAITLNALGKTYLATKQYPQSIKYASRSIKTAKDIQAQNLIISAAETLFKAYRQARDYENALKYHVLYTQYKDSLNQEANLKEIDKIKFNYDIENKETENVLLRNQNEWQAKQVALQKTLRNVFILGTLLLLGLVVVFLRGRLKEKKANLLLSQKNEEISAIAEHLTAANTEIEDQRQILEKVNKTKDKLFSVISHDLRSPLNSLQGLLTLLYEGDLSQDDVVQLFPAITQQLNHSHNLLDNLLVWAKSQMQGFQSHPKKIKISLLTEETVQLLKAPADQKNIQVINQIPSGIEAMGDEDMVKLVLRNLLANAIKFTPEFGNVSITIEHDGLDFIEVRVADTGIGISKEDQQKLFSENTYSTLGTTGEKGTGLGLLLSKDFVESNGGKIWVKSQKGKGSTFTFTIPAIHGKRLRKGDSSTPRAKGAKVPQNQKV